MSQGNADGLRIAVPVRAHRVPGGEALAEPLPLAGGMVRIELSYLQAGALRRVIGSGFVIEDWRSSVITARHVIAPPADCEVDDLVIELRSDQGRVRRRAVALAYPDTTDEADDVGVVRLCQETEGQAFALSSETPEEGALLDLVVRGYPSAGASERTTHLRGARSRGILRYLDGQGADGMSGGPVALAGAVLGIHSQADRAIVIDFDRHLNACHRRSISVEEEQ